MDNSLPHLLWSLVRLRYRLIWAHARTRAGKLALLFALYLLAALIAVFFLLGGFAAAVAGVQLGRGEEVARWMLSGLFLNGIVLTLVMGLGPREVFSDASLRRYPLTRAGRFAARHLIGLLDPIWVLLVMGAFGLAIGFALLGAGSILTGLPAALLFIAANYLAACVLLAFIGRLMQTRAGAAVVGVVALALVSFGPLGLNWLISSKRLGWWPILDQALRLWPPGAAATLLAGPTMMSRAVGAGLLIGWCALLAAVVATLERRSPISQAAVAGDVPWDSFYDRVANLFGRNYGPLVGKSLRYHLRCNAVRFGLVTAPLLVFMGKFLARGDDSGQLFFFTLAMLFVTGCAGTTAIMLNQFGFDGAGLRRYGVLPVPFVAALRAGSFASLLLGGAAQAVALSLWLVFSGSLPSVPMAVMLLGSAAAGLFLFNGLGLWTTVLSPRRLDFETVLGNRLSFGAQVVIFAGMFPPMMLAIMWADSVSPAKVLALWWAAPLSAALCFGFYLASWRLIATVLEARRERLISLIAGARSN